MKSMSRRLLALMLAIVAAMAVAACGGDDEGGGSEGGSSGASGNGEATAARQGGEATFNYGSFPDYLDPALLYTVDGLQAINVTHTPLLTYRRTEGAEGAQLMPGLAEAMPEITRGGRRYTLTLREGLKYSDGSPVRARDFEHAIKRVLNLESGGSSFYQTIDGATEYLEAGRARGDISGIETDDQTREIRIDLTEANGQFPYILAMWFASLVPSDTPFENQTNDPPPGTGPMRISEVNGTRSFTLERNTNYVEIPNLPNASLDKITVNVVKNQTRSIQDTQRNRVDWVTEPPAGDALTAFRQAAGDRFRPVTTNSTYYFFLNHRTEPFDDIRVRQAINFAVDGRALQRLFGGFLAPGCNFLPPGMQGYEPVEPCPYGDRNQPPDVERARQLIQEAGADGEQVTVYGNQEDPSNRLANYLADVMNDIGLRARPQILDGAVYFTTIGNQETKAQAGFANWFQDYPHPGNFMFLVDGDSIQRTNNQNFGNVDDPQINRALDELDPQDLSEAAAGYAQVDRRIVEQGHVVPYGHRQLPLITSERIAFDRVMYHPVLGFDFSSFALRQ